MSMMRRRVIAIVAAVIAIVILAFSLAGVLEYVKIIEHKDVDGTVYYAKNINGEYKLFAKGADTPLPLDEVYTNYFVTANGSLIRIDKSTGKKIDIIPVYSINGLDGLEEIDQDTNRVLIFNHIKKENILSIDVYNETGSYTFCRVNSEYDLDPKGSFIIKGSPSTTFNEEYFAELYASTGYTIAIQKIKDPIRDPSGNYYEYGLAPEVREREVTDEETGETIKETYNYTPSYYVLTDVNGVSHKVIIGDQLVTGGGYYAQYVDPVKGPLDSVFVLDNMTGNSVNAPIEHYVAPVLCYPMTMGTYFDVENFSLSHRNTDVYENGADLADIYDNMISFSYIDLSERENTMATNTPYVFELDLEGYSASTDAITATLYNFVAPKIIGTKKFAPTEQDLIDYGFLVEEKDENGETVKLDGKIQYTSFAKHYISYSYDVPKNKDDTSGTSQKIHQKILVSDRDYEETGNYYAYTYETVEYTDKKGQVHTLSFNYDYIIEVDGNTFNFLKWDEYDWLDPYYFNKSIAYIESIKISSPEWAYDYNASFVLDDSLTPTTGSGSSTIALQVFAEDSLGNIKSTFGRAVFLDVNDIEWTITYDDIYAYSHKTNKEQEINVSYYDYNSIGTQVLCRTGVINCKDGRKVEVSADYVTITNTNGTKEKLLRYDTYVFRLYLQTFLYSTIIDTYSLTKEEEAALISDPKNLLMTFEYVTRDAESAGATTEKTTVSFYKLPGTNRKAYIKIGDNGGFYVYTRRLEKFVTDSLKFFNSQLIDPTGKE